MQVEIGHGAHGVVFRATWRNTKVAVKQLIREDQPDEFLSEAILLQGLRSHPV